MFKITQKFTSTLKVAIAGVDKAGKSPLFNAIYGEKVATVSIRTDETQEAQTQERFGKDCTDTPGIIPQERVRVTQMFVS